MKATSSDAAPDETERRYQSKQDGDRSITIIRAGRIRLRTGNVHHKLDIADQPA